MSVPTFTKAGAKATTAATLPADVFGLENISHELLKQAYVAYLANGRQNLARTKTRGEVRGGGKKPWRQKGTGRARFGSIRVPIWRGGGITFGPTGTENYSHSLPVKTKRQAIRQALTSAATEGKISVIENLSGLKGKTSDAAKLLEKIGATKNVLLVAETKTIDTDRSVRNLPYVTFVQAMYLNVYDIMNADTIVMTTEAVAIVNNWLGTKAAPASKAPAKAPKAAKEVK